MFKFLKNYFKIRNDYNWDNMSPEWQHIAELRIFENQIRWFAYGGIVIAVVLAIYIVLVGDCV